MQIMRPIGPTIKATKEEYDWLLRERLAAWKAACGLHFGETRRPVAVKGRWGAYLRITGRRADGALLAMVYCYFGPSRKRYVRKVTVPPVLGSTTRRGLDLRVAGDPS